MKKFRRGFTLIEVALFLAVTGALFVGVTVGVQNSIFQQRYNDATQNFAEFLRGVYAETMNVQSLGTGMTERAIYGKLVTFGETTDLAGCPVNGGDSVMGPDCPNDKNRNAVFVYDVIGDVVDESTESGSGINILGSLNANVVRVDEANNRLQPVGVVESYSPKWAAQIEKVDSYAIFKGALLIMRHPRSGTVYTYVYKEESDSLNDALNINAKIARPVAVGKLQEWSDAIGAAFRGILGKFTQDRVDFCVNPNAGSEYMQRRDVRIISHSRNSSGIGVIATGSQAEGNECVME